MCRIVMLALAGLLAATVQGIVPARAGEASPSLFVGGIGVYDVLQYDDEAVDFRLEYRHGQGLWWFKPWVGVEATSDGALYGLGGILLDIPLAENLFLTGSAGVGAYSDGDGKDLGDTVEFRSQVELSYRFENNSRLGLSFGHISNAGLGDRNPGVEVLSVIYAIPLDFLGGET